MAKGTIRKLIGHRGFGFIRIEEGTEEKGGLFFRRNELEGVAYELLAEGQQVEFDLTPTSKGLQAVKVRLTG